MAPDKIYHNNGSYVAVEVISNIISDATAPDKLASVRFKNDEKLHDRTGFSFILDGSCDISF